MSFLFLRFAESVRKDLTRVAAEANLLLGDLFALRAMSQHGTAIHPSQLARRLDCARSNVTLIVQRLVAAGYVMEHRNAWAPRAKRLSLTESGHAVLAETMALLDEHDPFVMLRPRQQVQLARLLVQLTSDPFANDSACAPMPSSGEVVQSLNHLRWRGSSATELLSLEE